MTRKRTGKPWPVRMRVLGCDIGSRFIGIAVVERLECVQGQSLTCLHVSLWKRTRNESPAHWVRSVYQQIYRIICRWHPQIIAAEKPHFDPSYPVRFEINSWVTGAILALDGARVHGSVSPSVYLYSGEDVAFAVVGRHRPGKESVCNTVEKELKYTFSDENLPGYHLSDAAAVALHYMKEIK